jgi:hypothetical protein
VTPVKQTEYEDGLVVTELELSDEDRARVAAGGLLYLYRTDDGAMVSTEPAHFQPAEDEPPAPFPDFSHVPCQIGPEEPLEEVIEAEDIDD